MANLSRRDFTQSLLSTLLFYSLFDSIVSSSAFCTKLSVETLIWSKQLGEIARELRSKELSPTQWQDRVEAILSGVDLPDLLSRIDFARLQRGFHLRSDSADSFRLDFSELSGMSSTLNYATRIFGMREGRSIMPHGHHNLVSAHLAIQGNLHVRNFQRISDEPGYLLIEPTVDKVINVKDCSTQSSFRNNVHWFTAVNGSAYTFDVVVDGLEPDQESGLDFIDPLQALKAGEGRLRAPRLTREQAQKRYGNEIHH